MTQEQWDAIVIGGGAAGLSAAQALGRSLRRTLVLDGGAQRNRFASHMHNVLGLDGVPPLELVARGRAEASAYGVEFREATVSAVRDAGALLEVELDEGGALQTRAVIVSTGVTDELPEISGVAERWGRSVLHCPYCHGWEVRGQRIGVIATSPLSLHQAKIVRQWSDDVTVFTAGLVDEAGVSSLDPATERAFAARKVQLVRDRVVEVVGDGDQVRSVRAADGSEYAVDAIFTGSVMKPQDEFLAELALERADSPMGSFVQVDVTQRTSHPRIWAAGNVVTPAATVPVAMGAGMMAGAAVNAALVDEDFALAVGGSCARI